MSPSRDLTITYVPIDQLKENTKNARKHSRHQIRKLAHQIRRNGWTNPILADENGILIAGHGRLMAARMLGMTEVPVIRLLGLTEAQKLAIMLADNRLPEDAVWDEARLTIVLEEIVVLDDTFDLTDTGFEQAEIDIKLGATAQASKESVEAPDPHVPVVTRLGDVYTAGNHRIACGDSLLARIYFLLLLGEPVQVVFTDPPYNVRVLGHVTSNRRHGEFRMASGEMSQAQFTKFLRIVFEHIRRHCGPGAIAFTCMDWRHQREILDAADAAFEAMINLCVWNKTNGGMGSLYRSKHELVFVHKVIPGPHTNNVDLGRSGRYRTNVWDYAGVNTFRAGRAEDLGDHPTVKPVAMVADAILDVSKRGDIVLDPFMGSGSTVLAAEKTGRRARCIEIDPRYVDVALRRWIELTGQQPILESTGETFAEVAKRRATEPETEDA